MSTDFQWKVKERASEELRNKFPELSAVVVQLMANRGIETQEEVDGFLNPDYGQDQHDPYLFRDMQKVVDRIVNAIEKEEKIVIHGDYDADGVCASAVLYKTFQEIGVDVEIYLPHRDTEGYGLNMKTIQTLADEGTNLVITVDCGISNKQEITRAAELGMDVIVTDHHSEPTELPERAYAVLNPKLKAETYPFRYLAGVGVAFKLAQALIQKYKLGEAFEKWLLDLVAISTITDYVELIGENRIFVKYGLVVMQKNKRTSLRKLFEVMGMNAKTADTQTISFKIGPHINAAGRMNHANVALKLLIEEDEAQAEQFAQELAATNVERQQVSNQITKEAMQQAREQQGEYVVIVESGNWPVGLVGLVAGKVSSEFCRPSFVITTMGNEIVGSGRSIEQFHLVDALQSMDELFSKYGGHPMACGFSLKNKEAFEKFKKKMRERAQELLAGVDLRKLLYIEKELKLTEVNWELIEVIGQFAPFGQGNAEPIFSSKNVEVVGLSTVGKNSTHLRLTVSQDGVERPCIGFSFGGWSQKLSRGDRIDIAYAVSVNEWNGNKNLQLVIKDIKQPQ